MHNTGGSHHLHMRKRGSRNLAPYPHPNAFKRFLDRFMYVVAIGGPLSTLPQVFQVFETRDVSSLSFTTWGLWFLLSIVWLIYGFVHKDMPIIISQMLYVALNGVIVLMIFVYGS